MAKKHLVFVSKGKQDLIRLEKKYALQVMDDLPILENPPWPQGKVKPLRGTDFWEMKTGDFRTIFWPDKDNVVILRVVNRRDLVLAVKGMNPITVLRWLRENRDR